MRLKQMGDVVFSGASSRPASGAAEVTLVLQSDDGHWKETDGCLEVRRRVFKTGPSDYRLNGRSVRLKDIFDELAEVGLSTRAYSIIEQGRVGQVLSARPIDRRALLEEAAGITRYKARKHEAELKLVHTRQNLLRLEDVIGEVDRSLRQLKRQAKQADLDATFMGPEGVGNKDINTIAGEAAEGLLVTLPPSFDEKEENQELVKAFEEKGEDPSGPFVLTSYAAVQLIAEGIEAADSTDPFDVAEALRDGTFQTPIGTVEYDSKGDMESFEFVVYEWHSDGSKTPVN